VFATETAKRFRAATFQNARGFQPALMAHGDRLKAGDESCTNESNFIFLLPD